LKNEIENLENEEGRRNLKIENEIENLEEL
jgi:hypothetical protein